MKTHRQGRSVEKRDAILHSKAQFSKYHSFTAIALLTEMHTYTLYHIPAHTLFLLCAPIMVSCELQQRVFVYRCFFYNFVHMQVCQVLYYTSLALCYFCRDVRTCYSTGYLTVYQHSTRNQPTKRCFQETQSRAQSLIAMLVTVQR